jgi:hypothetical protein
MSRYILAPYTLRLTIHTDTIDEQNWFNLIQVTQGLDSQKEPFTGRTLLIEKMRKCIANKVRKELMTIATSQQFFKDVFQMLEWYIRAACPDFKLWLTNASPYDADGFEEKSYWTQDLEDELMDIYNNGE